MNNGFFNNNSYLFMNDKSRSAGGLDGVDTNVDLELPDLANQVNEKNFQELESDLELGSTVQENRKSTEDNVRDIVEQLESRFKIRRMPHSLDRLERVLGEDRFKDSYSEYMFNEVVRALEDKSRFFEKKNTSPQKRNSRNRKRGR